MGTIYIVPIQGEISPLEVLDCPKRLGNNRSLVIDPLSHSTAEVKPLVLGGSKSDPPQEFLRMVDQSEPPKVIHQLGLKVRVSTWWLKK